ncbi:Fetal brain protein 239, partial [hydrothermal vent metagenome]
MRLVIVSDTHGMHNEVDIPSGDIFIHAGDFTGNGTLEEVEDFNHFLAGLDHTHKIVISGNHEYCFEKEPRQSQDLLNNCIYLQDNATIIEGIKFYGSPWQPWFFNWAFNLERGAEIRKKWELIDNDTDVLITHGPPVGHGDEVVSGERVGCEDLIDFVDRIKPKYHIFGHIHEGYGISHNSHTTFINAST